MVHGPNFEEDFNRISAVIAILELCNGRAAIVQPSVQRAQCDDGCSQTIGNPSIARKQPERSEMAFCPVAYSCNVYRFLASWVARHSFDKCIEAVPRETTFEREFLNNTTYRYHSFNLFYLCSHLCMSFLKSSKEGECLAFQLLFFYHAIQCSFA